MAGRLVTIGQYPHRRRCPSTWWTPPPSKRLERVNPVRRVRFPSTSANAEGVALGCTESGGAKRRIPSTSANAEGGSFLLLDGLEGRAHERRSPEIADESVEHVVHHVHDREVQIEIVDDRRTSPTSPEARTAIGR